MDLSQQATRLALLRWAREQIDEQYQDTRAALSDELDPTDRKAARLGGQRLGYVSKTNGRTSAKVTDEPALIAWCRHAHPDEIIECVRPSFVERLKSDAKHYGAAVDTTTGEVVPGIDVVAGEPYITVKLDDHAAELIAANWSEVIRQVPELPA